MSTPSEVIEVGEGFWNIRVPFKVRGVLNVTTQASLVRLASGKFVLLDACSLSADVQRFIGDLTHGGDDIEAIINVHPFHTVFVAKVHALYPKAKLYGTQRHRDKRSDLPWEDPIVEDDAFNELYTDDFDFSVPKGVDFVASNENFHFSSVLVFHRASRTLHVDDSFNYVRFPKAIAWMKKDMFSLHPTYHRMLQPRAGAAEEFRAWGREVEKLARDTENVCAAHMATLLGRKSQGPSVAERVRAAMAAADGKLAAHTRKYG